MTGPCKIRQATNDCFFSIAGAQDFKKIHYDLVPLAAAACQGTGSISERAEHFKKAALPEIRRSWVYIKKREPKGYALMKQNGPAHLAVVFAGVHPLVLVIVQFIEDSQGQMIPDELIVKDQTVSHKTEITVVGEYQKIDAYRNEHHELDQLDDVLWVPAVLSKATDLEQPESIKRIGPPIAVLEITNTGTRWIQQGECQNLKDFQLPKMKPSGSSPKPVATQK